MKEYLTIPCPKEFGGRIRVERAGDPDFPGVYVYYERDNGEQIDIVCVEAPNKLEDTLRAFVWGDPKSDSYTHKFKFTADGLN